MAFVLYTHIVLRKIPDGLFPSVIKDCVARIVVACYRGGVFPPHVAWRRINSNHWTTYYKLGTPGS